MVPWGHVLVGPMPASMLRSNPAPLGAQAPCTSWAGLWKGQHLWEQVHGWQWMAAMLPVALGHCEEPSGHPQGRRLG